ncbi:hypothetical protein B0H12DRAFT_1082237 [Mycena haematopus]|nr:hypothetical protein B0H12DRAFT_1082237 [Mycena haematopus]
MSENLTALLDQLIDSSPEHRIPKQRRDDLRALAEASNETFELVQKLDSSMAVLSEAILRRPLLPHPVNNLLDHRLNEIRQSVQNVDTSALPHEIGEDPESDYEAGVPIFRLLSTVHPKGYRSDLPENDLRVRSVIFTAVDTPPIHQKWRIPNPLVLHCRDYPPPPGFTTWKGFFIYSQADAGYENCYHKQGVDVSMHGRILILVKEDLITFAAQWPALKTWKARARSSIEEQAHSRNHIDQRMDHPSDVASPFPPSSPPNELASEAEYAPGSSKRKAMSDPAESESGPAKKAKAEGVEAPASSRGNVVPDEGTHDVEETFDEPVSPVSIISISSDSDRDDVILPSVIVITSDAPSQSIIEISSDSDSELPTVSELIERSGKK